MEREAANPLPGLDFDLLRGRRNLVLGGFFLLVWPAINLLFISLVLLELGFFDTQMVSSIALRMYTGFLLAYGIITLLQRLFPQTLPEDRFWPQLALHAGTFFLLGQLSEPMLTELPQIPRPTVVPLVFMLFQVTLFVAVKTLIIQRDHHLATQLYLRQAQINVLRSQSNPHFLFNTLNLLASEIGRNPDTARDIVYDLADLLRDSMQAAERAFISLDEEVRLATLYLTLQQKRFPDRLSVDIDIEDRCRDLSIPSLILQPLVENVVKHVVSRSNGLTTLALWAHERDGSLLVGVRDNGPKFDTGKLEVNGGLRIVRDTLALHYQGRADMVFESTQYGSQVTLSLPLQPEPSGE